MASASDRWLRRRRWSRRIADGMEARSVHSQVAFLGSVQAAEIQRVHIEFFADLVDQGVDGKLGLRRAGRTIGVRLGLVDDDVVAVHAEVLDVERSYAAQAAGPNGGAGVAAGLEGQVHVDGRYLPSVGDAHLDRHERAGCGAGADQYLGAAHGHLDGAADLAGQHGRQRFQIDGGLAAEAAADFRRKDADLRLRVHEHGGQLVADSEMALRTGFHDQMPVLVPVGQRVVRLDVALVDHGGGIGPLHDQVGRRIAGLDVAFLVNEVLGDVAELVVEDAAGFGVEVVEDDRRVVTHGFAHVQHGRQDFVVHVDQTQGFLGVVDAGGGHGGDDLALRGDAPAGDDPLGHVAQALHAGLVGFGLAAARVGKVVAGDHGQNLAGSLGARRIDAANARPRVRAAQHFAPDHARHAGVHAVACPSRDLIHAVVTDRSGPNDSVCAVACCHSLLPRCCGGSSLKTDVRKSSRRRAPPRRTARYQAGVSCAGVGPRSRRPQTPTGPGGAGRPQPAARPGPGSLLPGDRRFPEPWRPQSQPWRHRPSPPAWGWGCERSPRWVTPARPAPPASAAVTWADGSCGGRSRRGLRWPRPPAAARWALRPRREHRRDDPGWVPPR